MKEKIFVTKPFLPPFDEFSPYLRKIWDSKILTNQGEFHRKFEKELAEYLGVKYISLFCNGTLALITALQALKISGEVITTPYSFVATTHALWWNNIKPVFVDIEPDTFNIDASKIKSAITQKTTAILPVHVYGYPCDVKKIKVIAETYGLKIIYDACHSFGVRINNVPVVNFGDLSVLSFHATKVFNTFEGGAIICHDKLVKKRIDYLKNFGITGETNVVGPGINAKMNEFQAALGLLQLKYADKIIEKRRRITEYYRKYLRKIKGISFLEDIKNVKHSYTHFPILINYKKYGICRDDLYDKFKRHNIYTRRYFYPLISGFPVYKELESALPENLPVAEYVAKNILCLPLYPDLKIETIDKIICIIGKIKRH